MQNISTSNVVHLPLIFWGCQKNWDLERSLKQVGELDMKSTKMMGSHFPVSLASVLGEKIFFFLTFDFEEENYLSGN